MATGACVRFTGKKWKKREIYGMSWNIKGYKIEGSPSLTCFFMFKP
jgi:hypothetical protein